MFFCSPMSEWMRCVRRWLTHDFAPVQGVTWGHPETTGSAAMDFFLSSELLETEQGHEHYTERLVRMPLLGTYYERPRSGTEAASRPR